MLLRKVFFLVVPVLILISACKKEDPAPQEQGKLITDVDLLFNPVAGGAPLSFSATDPENDGEGDLIPDEITLPSGQSFQLFIRLRNDVDNVDLTKTIEEKSNDHMIYFGFTDPLFDQPEGDGNIDSRGDQVNYIDEDENGLPLGLITGWQTGAPGTGSFRVMLKHQPDLKTATSGSDVGNTDLDLTFSVTIE